MSLVAFTTRPRKRELATLSKGLRVAHQNKKLAGQPPRIEKLQEDNIRQGNPSSSARTVHSALKSIACSPTIQPNLPREMSSRE